MAAHQSLEQRKTTTPEDRAEHMRCARVYYKVCSAFKQYLSQCMNREVTALYRAGSLRTGTHVHTNVQYSQEKTIDTFWFSLKNWRDEDPESDFDDLGAWAEEKDGYASRIRRGKATNFSCDHVSCS